MNPKLEMEIIWEDEHMIKVKVFACNDLFSGSADCYTSRTDIEDFAQTVSGYPKTIDDQVSFGTGDSEPDAKMSNFLCTFKPTHRTGHYMANINIYHVITYSGSHKESSSVDLEFGIEPASIDIFVTSLNTLSLKPRGEFKAVLNGKA